MTAIADIIVNPSAGQKQELQVSQNLNLFNQNSSNVISFAQMLESNRAANSYDSTFASQTSCENSSVNYANEASETRTDSAKETNSVKKNDETKSADKNEAVKNSEKTSEKAETKAEKTSDENEKTEKTGNAEKSEKGEKLSVNQKDDLKKTGTGKSADKTDLRKKLETAQKTGSKNNVSQSLEEDYNRLSRIIGEYQNDFEKTAKNLVKSGSKNEASDVQDELLVQNLTADENINLETLNKTANLASKQNTRFAAELEDENSVDSKKGKISKLDKDGKILVKDLRSAENLEKSDKDLQAKLKSSDKNAVTLELNDKNNATITMELASQNAENNILSLNNQSAAGDNSNFHAMLSNQIQQNAPEFVKAGSIILKDNKQGTINLVLHPDDLGSVKIHLSLDGKTISANITVNTKEALEVFKDNAHTLREAFAQNGFDTSNFDVSYNNPNGNSNGQQEYGNLFDNNEYIAKRAYEDFGDTEVNGFIQNEDFFEKYSEYSVNIVA
ncbi:MAG: flagellar hook-length control protein FliK [Treponema sp.]|nr:flagellar hook-length control protein FliK [Treponema sp.]